MTKSLLCSYSSKSIGPPSCYLGNDYNWSEDEKAWVLGCATYSQLLDLNGIHKYQMLIGMAQWACTIGHLDIAFAVLSLSHFSANL